MSTDTSNEANCDLEQPQAIRIRGARVHNLRSVNVDIPRDAITVVTGVSGSGKSSLAFDTLYAEGQRQYIESLSAYARQFLNQMQRPDVDLVEGLEPTLCIDQRPGLANPRSTVGTITEVYDYLRLLFARAGLPHCPGCGQTIEQQSTEQIIETFERLPEGSKLMLLSPLVRGRRGSHQDVFGEIAKAGLVRARVDGEFYALEDLPTLDARRNHTIEAVVDRIVWKPAAADRLADSVRLALKIGQGALLGVVQLPGQDLWSERLQSTLYACLNCGQSFPPLEPRTFSFNSPHGACPRCEGMGRVEQFDPELVLTDLQKSLADGAVSAWKGTSQRMRRETQQALEPLLKTLGSGWESPLDRLADGGRRRLLHGDNKQLGILGLLDLEWESGPTEKRAKHLEQFRTVLPCPACEGSRLRPETRAVTVGGLGIQQTTALPIKEAIKHIESLSLEGLAAEVARPLTAEILKRLRFLNHVGLDYLTLERAADTLSGGELQRVRLASSIGSGLVGVCYVLDEPSIGLHQRDNDRLIKAMRELQQAGNTLVVVEHDEAMMRAADWIIDMGPGAGNLGGQILAVGPPESIMENPASVTGAFLAGRKKVAIEPSRRNPSEHAWLRLKGVTTNNLQSVDLNLPLGLLIGITGVSGSGKSSLINDTLYPALAKKLGGNAPKPGPHESLAGYEAIEKIIAIDQSPIGRSPRSCPATFTGVFDLIRRVFATTREAKQRGFSVSRFSFNSSEGRCPQCQGQGAERIEMNFLSDLSIVCSMCGGKRFNQQTLRIRYKNATIADCLAMTVDQAAEFFCGFSKIDRFLQAMRGVGLGYLQLGQSSTTLSGGEAQRLKLATELARSEHGKTLYLLDEPTTGLHFEDVSRLIRVLDSLVAKGNTVVVIEHNLDVAYACDWLVDLGPEGGKHGGQIMASGSPALLARNSECPTGPYLKPYFSI